MVVMHLVARETTHSIAEDEVNLFKVCSMLLFDKFSNSSCKYQISFP